MRLGIISDVHEDIASLRRAMVLFTQKKCDLLVCLGDITGFDDRYYSFSSSHHANECISLIRSEFRIVVAGNHDLNTLKHSGHPIPIISSNMLDGVVVAPEWKYENTSLPEVSESGLDWLSGLKIFDILAVDDKKYLFSHFLYPDLAGAIAINRIPGRLFRSHNQFLINEGCNISFCGHAHINGAVLVTTFLRKQLGFGKSTRLKKTKTVLAPCLASGVSASGIAIFETKSALFEVLPIQGPAQLNGRSNLEDSQFLGIC